MIVINPSVDDQLKEITKSVEDWKIKKQSFIDQYDKKSRFLNDIEYVYKKDLIKAYSGDLKAQKKLPGHRKILNEVKTKVLELEFLIDYSTNTLIALNENKAELKRK